MATMTGDSQRRGKSKGQERRKAMDVLRARRDFLASRVEAARADGKDLSYDAREVSALDWALAQLAPFATHDVLTDPPPAGTPVTLACDPGTVVAVRVGTEFYCVCGSPERLTGAKAWEPAPPTPELSD